MRVLLPGLKSAAMNGCLARTVSVDTERAGVALDCGRRLAIVLDWMRPAGWRGATAAAVVVWCRPGEWPDVFVVFVLDVFATME